MRLMQCLTRFAVPSAITQSILAAICFAAAGPSSFGDPSVTPAAQAPEMRAASQENAVPKVKALYLTGWTVGGTARLQHYVDLARTTELNAYVVDIKDVDGNVGYETQVPLAREIKA